MKNIMPPIDTPDNIFHDGNPVTGEQGTIVPGLWLTNVQGATRNTQQELISVLAEAGIEINESENDQLLLAILSLISTHSPELPVASLILKGIVQLSSSTSSSSETLAATPKAVKAVNDAALKIANNLSEIAAAGSPSVISALTNLKLTESTDGYVGRLVRVTTFPTSGTVTFNTNTKQVIFKIWGAGQGGGSAAAATSASGGASGAGGGYTEVIANVKSLGLANVAITIGSGGSPAVLNSGTQGVAGGATVVGTLATAGGGSNGTGGSLTVNPLIGTIISVNGQNGQGGGVSGTGATGGAASWSFGGLPHAASVGDNGGFPGGGAAGGANISPSNNYIGGRGANGLVIVEEYA
ncbi:tail fiber repeat 2-containing protein [Yersinia frederiksenii]|nr:tail fiber repeat 2-containing protein [Yersinia frederiksenii]